MVRPVGTRLTIMCLPRDWSVETTNASAEVTTACTLPTGPLATHNMRLIRLACSVTIPSNKRRSNL